ncbi:MAG: hypothetical protein ACE5HM_05650 [Acidiferrobacterales bacterium]
MNRFEFAYELFPGDATFKDKGIQHCLKRRDVETSPIVQSVIKVCY